MLRIIVRPFGKCVREVSRGLDRIMMGHQSKRSEDGRKRNTTRLVARNVSTHSPYTREMVVAMRESEAGGMSWWIVESNINAWVTQIAEGVLDVCVRVIVCVWETNVETKCDVGKS